MITKKMVIEFHEQRLKSTVKIIETLRDLKKTNLTTHLIDCEIEMQEGERDLINETLIFLKQENNEDKLIVVGETKCGGSVYGDKKEKEEKEVTLRIKGSDLLEVLDRVKVKEG